MLIESHDEWQVAERRYLSEASRVQLTPPPPTAITAAGHEEGVIDTASTRTAYSTRHRASRGMSHTTRPGFILVGRYVGGRFAFPLVNGNSPDAAVSR